MTYRASKKTGMTRLDRRVVHYYLEWARTRFWLIPISMCVIALLLALATLELDRHCNWCAQLSPVSGLGIDATRNLMGVLATSILSVGGVSFSITMVALSMTSGQYGPKVMRYFLADTRSKVSIGLFFATALFALVVFVGVEEPLQPRLTVFAAVSLALLALMEFMRFIHRTSTDLQADEIIQRLGRQTRADLSHLQEHSPKYCAERVADTQQWRQAARKLQAAQIPSPSEGYIQTIDFDGLVANLAAQESLALLRVRPGDFVLCKDPVLSLWSTSGVGEESLDNKHSSFITAGSIRTAADDAQFPITQIQQIAARALSPGINDPGTAITCIDWLTVCLAEIVDSDLVQNVFVDAQGEPRLLIPRLDFEIFCDNVYSPPRRLTADNIPVAICLMDSKIRLAKLTQRPERLGVIQKHATLLMDCVERAGHCDYDLRMVRQRYQKVRRLTSS
ncbi:MAG: DUF2254 domain-containing protein [Congregibacter sp.]|nr:DUF2254 domain-containing protein [Congregibacter sp.]